MRFRVIDTKTGKEPDLREIALHEDWAKRLTYCDMEGFAIEDDGALLLLDECGNYAYCPLGRFKVELLLDDEVPENRKPATEAEIKAFIERQRAEGKDPYPITEETFKKLEEAGKDLPDLPWPEDDDL